MNCPVCGKSFKGNACTVCSFPVVDIPGDYEEGLKALRPTIDSFKAEFVKKVNIGVVLNKWQLENGKLKLVQEENESFGTLEQLMGRSRWISRTFDNISTKKNVDVSVFVDVAKDDGSTDRKILHVSTPNMNDGENQQLGITVNNDFTFVLNVKSSTGQKGTSESIYLFN